MANFQKELIKAKMSENRSFQDILDEYNVRSSDVKVEDDYVSFIIFGKRNERLTPPNNGDLWILESDSGLLITNDIWGQFFAIAVHTEDETLYLTEHDARQYLMKYFEDVTLPLGCEDDLSELLLSLPSRTPDWTYISELIELINEECPEPLDITGADKIRVVDHYPIS